jgi:lysophospholipase L1-like esterase
MLRNKALATAVLLLVTRTWTLRDGRWSYVLRPTSQTADDGPRRLHLRGLLRRPRESGRLHHDDGPDRWRDCDSTTWKADWRTVENGVHGRHHRQQGPRLPLGAKAEEIGYRIRRLPTAAEPQAARPVLLTWLHVGQSRVRHTSRMHEACTNEGRPVMFQSTFAKGALAVCAVAVGLLGQACSTAAVSTEPVRLAATGDAPAPAIHVVVLGDSIATTNACPGCAGFPDLYGRAIARRTGSDVEVQNLAVPGSGVADLLGQVQGDSSTRQALADADVVVVTIGFNDTPWGRGDDPCNVAPDFPVVLWDQITDQCIASVTSEYAERLDAVLTTVGGIAPEHSALRVVGVYNSVIGDHVDESWDSPEAVAPSIEANTAFVAAQEAAAKQHGGVFVDMLQRINGPLGRKEAGKYLAVDYTHLNQRGHELTARALAQSGWKH